MLTSTIECIKSLFAMEYKQFRVVICDNNSPDNSYNKIKEILNITSEDLASKKLVELTKKGHL